METKSDKFIRLAEGRTNDVLNKIRLISNLSNRRNYDYSKKEVQQIFSAIEAELLNAKKMFETNLSKSDDKFKL